MLKDVTLYEAKQYKDRMENVDGVGSGSCGVTVLLIFTLAKVLP